MPRIKILQKGWEGFSGNMGTTLFKDGYADTNDIEAKRIGASIHIVEVDEDGNEGHQISTSLDLIRGRSISATVVQRRFKPMGPDVTDEDIDAELDEFAALVDEAAGDEHAADPLEELELDKEQERPTFYTREELEKIADEGGIAALREIATPLGLKDTSIGGLIEKIIQHQG